MIIEVRPTSALRRHRARVAGAVTGLILVAATLCSVAELATTGDSGTSQAPSSDAVSR